MSADAGHVLAPANLPQSHPKSLGGLAVAAVLLFVTPFIYVTDSQPFSVTLAANCILSAWSILHLTLLDPVDIQPSLLAVVMLPVVHMSRGVKKAYHKSQLQGSYPGTDKSAASKPVVVVEAEGDDVMAASSMHGAYGNTTSTRSASLCNILRAAKELLLVCIACDFGLYVLCACTSMCESPVSSTSLLGARGLTEYMRHGIVSLSFILLLGGVMDIFYCWAMLLLTMAAAVVPSIRDMPQQYPKHAFVKPLSATSVRDFWSFRWHQFFRFYFEGLGRAAVDGLLGPIHVPFVIRATLYTVVAFGMSGVLHEYLSWASTGRAIGLFMVFSAVEFVAVVVEAVCGRVCKAAIAPLLGRGLGGTAGWYCSG